MSTTNQSNNVPKKVLVTGASGLLGVAAIEKFLAAGWQVVGVSRRKPELPSGRDINFLSVDLRDQDKARAAFEKFSPSHKREYVDWITEAKTEATRTRRIETAIEWMGEGKPRNWKYMNC